MVIIFFMAHYTVLYFYQIPDHRSDLPKIGEKTPYIAVLLESDVIVISSSQAHSFKWVYVDDILYRVFIGREGVVLAIDTCDPKFSTPGNVPVGIPFAELEKQYGKPSGFQGIKLDDGWTARPTTKNVTCFLKR